MNISEGYVNNPKGDMHPDMTRALKVGRPITERKLELDRRVKAMELAITLIQPVTHEDADRVKKAAEWMEQWLSR